MEKSSDVSLVRFFGDLITITPNHTTSGHQNRRLRNVGGGESPALGDF